MKMPVPFTRMSAAIWRAKCAQEKGPPNASANSNPSDTRWRAASVGVWKYLRELLVIVVLSFGDRDPVSLLTSRSIDSRGGVVNSLFCFFSHSSAPDEPAVHLHACYRDTP